MWNSKDFENQRETVRKHFKRVGFSEDNVVDFCTMAGLPLTVVYKFISEDMPAHIEICNNKIKEINKFYGIGE